MALFCADTRGDGGGGGGGGGGGRRSSDSSSPEFEFWVVGNPSFPQTHLMSADELFVDGVLLPLRLLNHTSEPTLDQLSPERLPEPESEQQLEPIAEVSVSTSAAAASEPAAAISSSSATSSSKRWTDIFKVVGEKKGDEREKESRKERKNSAGGSAELNINIWPFSRSRSAGNGGGSRPKGPAAAGRKVSSAPCSRSNSRGESSKSTSARKWASSPGRPGLHVGRTSPVWQVRRGAGKKGPEPIEGFGSNTSTATISSGGGGGRRKGSGGGVGVRVLNLNVNTCIGYRNQLSCRGDDKSDLNAGDRTRGSSTPESGSHFNLRTLFSKKVY